MAAELNCYICRNLLTNPVLLPCGHSLCIKCAENYYRYTADGSCSSFQCVANSCEKSSQNYQVKCPICNFDFSLPNGGVNKLVRNYALERLVAKMEKRQGIFELLL